MDLEAHLFSLCEPVLNDSGYELVKIQISGTGPRPKAVFFIDKQGGISVDDCAAASRLIDPLIEQNDLFKSSRHIVEVEDGVIVLFAKTKENIDGVEDLVDDARLEKKLAGKTPAECAEAEKLGPPLRTLRSRERAQLLRVYDVRHWTDFMGARYCVLRFDGSDRCESVSLIGVSASTRKDPIRR